MSSVSIFQNRGKQKNFKVKIMIVTSRIVGMTERIIDDTCIVSDIFTLGLMEVALKKNPVRVNQKALQKLRPSPKQVWSLEALRSKGEMRPMTNKARLMRMKATTKEIHVRSDNGVKAVMELAGNWLEVEIWRNKCIVNNSCEFSDPCSVVVCFCFRDWLVDARTDTTCEYNDHLFGCGKVGPYS